MIHKKYTADNANLLLHINKTYKKNKKILITDKYWPESVLTDKPLNQH